MFELLNKNAVITGGGSGIGRATAFLLGKRQATVYVIDKDEKNALETAAMITSAGGNAFAKTCDLTNQREVLKVYEGISKIDILVNSAGISHIGKVETTNEEDFDRVYNVNVKGVYNSIYAALPLMKAGSSIVNLASIASSVGIPDRFAYSMTKGAVLAMTLSVAKDYVSKGIRCNCVSPGRVHTSFVDGFLAKNYPGKEKEMFEKLSATQPIGRMAQPEEIAYLILYLSSDEASFITGSDYPIDGGFIRINN